MKLYIMTHRAFTPPEKAGYIPLQVGAALHDDLGYERDDHGKQISEKNLFYSELTGLYWVWKNANLNPEELVGLVHYRRYFVNEVMQPMSEEEVQAYLGNYDVILSPHLVLETSVKEQYRQSHVEKDMDLVEDAIKKISPEYLPTFRAFMEGNRMHFANMFVMRAKHMEAYCSWLFSILFEIEKHMDLTGYDDYNRRVYGFLAERLLTVWVLQQQLDYTEAPVALVAEKADIRAAGEMLRAYIEQKDMQAAGTYYQTLHEEHPDFFYAGAGVGEEFVVACLVVEIHQLESRVGESHFIRNRSFEEMQTLLTRFRDLLKQGGSAAGAVYTLVKTEELSPVFVAFMVSQFVTDATDKLYIYSGLAEGYAAANDGQTAMYYAKLAMQGK